MSFRFAKEGEKRYARCFQGLLECQDNIPRCVGC